MVRLRLKVGIDVIVTSQGLLIAIMLTSMRTVCLSVCLCVCQEFCLVHYAGPVTYDVNGFLDKNSDLLYRDLKQVRLCVT